MSTEPKKKIRASDEVNQLIAQLMSDADALKTKYADTDMPADDVAKLQDLVSQLEALEGEKQEAEASERIAGVKARMDAAGNKPRLPAPKLASSDSHQNTGVRLGEGLHYFLKGESSPEAAYKSRSLGFQVGSPQIRVPVNYDKLNYKQRTILSKSGAGSGLEWQYQTYSDLLTEYMLFESPVLGLVNVETLDNGQDETFFTVDNTGMISTYTSASSGSETNPTIPDSNLVSKQLVLKCFDITSGYQKVSFNELRDAAKAVKLEDQIAKASALSHTRKIESEMFNGTGNGTTGVQGLLTAANVNTPVSAWSQDVLLDLQYAIPVQYQDKAIYASSQNTKAAVYKATRDDIGRTLFTTTVENGMSWNTYLDRKWYISQYIPDGTVLCFVPDYYILKFVSEQIFQKFVEKFAPNIAWSGIMSFGGAWNGPASAVQSVSHT